MAAPNGANERVKRRYFEILWKEAATYAPETIDRAAAALTDFERVSESKDFKTFGREQAVVYKRNLTERLNLRTAQPLSQVTVQSKLSDLTHFFQWLARQPGYRRLSHDDAEFFSLSGNNQRIAAAQHYKTGPTLDEVYRLFERNALPV